MPSADSADSGKLTNSRNVKRKVIIITTGLVAAATDGLGFLLSPQQHMAEPGHCVCVEE
jgi:hypothetical protein